MPPDPRVFDAAYIEALRRGDPATEKHFVDHFSPILLRKLRGNVRTIDQARDLRQETFLRVLSAIRSSRGIRKPERFEVFVICVCNNVLHEWWREQRRIALLQPVEIDLPGDSPSAYAVVLAEETRRSVRRVLSNLDKDEQGILHAVLMDEQDKDEVCRRFGVSRSYLRVLLHRAKKEFRKRAGKELPVTAKRRPPSRRTPNLENAEKDTEPAIRALLTQPTHVAMRLAARA